MRTRRNPYYGKDAEYVIRVVTNSKRADGSTFPVGYFGRKTLPPRAVGREKGLIHSEEIITLKEHEALHFHAEYAAEAYRIENYTLKTEDLYISALARIGITDRILPYGIYTEAVAVPPQKRSRVKGHILKKSRRVRPYPIKKNPPPRERKPYRLTSGKYRTPQGPSRGRTVQYYVVSVEMLWQGKVARKEYLLAFMDYESSIMDYESSIPGLRFAPTPSIKDAKIFDTREAAQRAANNFVITIRNLEPRLLQDTYGKVQVEVFRPDKYGRKNIVKNPYGIDIPYPGVPAAWAIQVYDRGGLFPLRYVGETPTDDYDSVASKYEAVFFPSEASAKGVLGDRSTRDTIKSNYAYSFAAIGGPAIADIRMEVVPIEREAVDFAALTPYTLPQTGVVEEHLSPPLSPPLPQKRRKSRMLLYVFL